MVNQGNFKRKFIKFIDEPRMVTAKVKGVGYSHAFAILKCQKVIGKQFNTLIDVGASVGTFTGAFKVYNKDYVKIFCFEPVTQSYNQLKLNHDEEATCYQIALSNRNEHKNMNVIQDRPSDSSILERNADNLKIKIQNVVCKRFDSLDIVKLISPVLLKIDVEGYELKVLEGFGDKLNDIDVILLEHHFANSFKGAGKLSEIFELLEEHGFNNHSIINERDTHNNYIIWKEML